MAIAGMFHRLSIGCADAEQCCLRYAGAGFHGDCHYNRETLQLIGYVDVLDSNGMTLCLLLCKATWTGWQSILLSAGGYSTASVRISTSIL